MLFSERLKQARKFKKLKQKDVAEALHLDRTSYTGYETGKSKPTFEKLIELSEFLDVSVDYLLGKTNNPIIFDVTYEIQEDFDSYKVKIADDLSVLKDYMVMENEDKKAVTEFIEARKLLNENSKKTKQK